MPSSRRLLKQILENQGHTVFTAGDGNEAISIARDPSVDLVLCDVNMPNMSASSCSKTSNTRRLSNHSYRYGQTESDGYKKEKLKALGANGCLRKPFTEEQIINILSHFLK